MLTYFQPYIAVFAPSCIMIFVMTGQNNNWAFTHIYLFIYQYPQNFKSSVSSLYVQFMHYNICTIYLKNKNGISQIVSEIIHLYLIYIDH